MLPRKADETGLFWHTLLSSQSLTGFIGVCIGAVVTLFGESWRDTRKAKRYRYSVLRGLRRSSANLVQGAAPKKRTIKDVEQGKAYAIRIDQLIIAPYLDEGIALTATNAADLALDQHLIQLKKAIEQVNYAIQTAPALEMQILLSPL